MTDLGPDDENLGPIDLSGKPAQRLDETREKGFQIMKAHMMNVYAKKNQHVQPMIRAAKIGAYNQALEDAFNVFRQVVEPETSEELTPGL